MSGSENAGQGQGGPEGPQMIDLDRLPIEQLDALRAQFESDVKFFQDAITSLKDVQLKMVNSETSLREVQEQSSDSNKTILVPLSSSMYVPGEIDDKNHVIVDIGTGYFVQKTFEEAKDYFKRKIEFITKQIEGAQKVGREKADAYQAIREMFEEKKLKFIRAQQESARKEIKQ